MVAPRMSVGRALRVLEGTVPWANVTKIPSVSTTVAFAVAVSDGGLNVVAFDVANDRRHTFVLSRPPSHPDRAVHGAVNAIHATFN